MTIGSRLPRADRTQQRYTTHTLLSLCVSAKCKSEARATYSFRLRLSTVIARLSRGYREQFLSSIIPRDTSGGANSSITGQGYLWKPANGAESRPSPDRWLGFFSAISLPF